MIANLYFTFPSVLSLLGSISVSGNILITFTFEIPPRNFLFITLIENYSTGVGFSSFFISFCMCCQEVTRCKNKLKKVCPLTCLLFWNKNFPTPSLIPFVLSAVQQWNKEPAKWVSSTKKKKKQKSKWQHNYFPTLHHVIVTSSWDISCWSSALISSLMYCENVTSLFVSLKGRHKLSWCSCNSLYTSKGLFDEYTT